MYGTLVQKLQLLAKLFMLLLLFFVDFVLLLSGPTGDGGEVGCVPGLRYVTPDECTYSIPTGGCTVHISLLKFQAFAPGVFCLFHFLACITKWALTA